MPGASVQLLKVAPDGVVWAGAGCSLIATPTGLADCDRELRQVER